MPTAGKLAAALLFTALGWVFIGVLSPLYPEGIVPQFFEPICLAVGFLVGWMIVGKNAGRGYSAAVAQGLTGAAALLIWVLFLTSLVKMVRQSMRGLYSGPTDAVLDIARLMGEQGQRFLVADVAIAWALGGLLAAFLTEAVARRWP